MVQFDENDVMNKYGFTNKMNEIWRMVENDIPLEKAKFEVTEEDRKYYEECVKEDRFMTKINGGVRKRMLRFFND